jgi:hypothetical protein
MIQAMKAAATTNQITKNSDSTRPSLARIGTSGQLFSPIPG